MEAARMLTISEQSVGALQQTGGAARRPVAFLAQVLQPVAIEAHHAGFGAGEER